MRETRYLDDDIIHLQKVGDGWSEKEEAPVLFWGDRVTIVEKDADRYIVELREDAWDPGKRQHYVRKLRAGLPKKARFRDGPLFKLRVLDVGQGDGAIIETPAGRIILVDGGEGDNMRLYVRRAFHEILESQPVHCDAIVVTHGDADHNAGLTDLVMDNWWTGSPVVTADRVYHNGLVKTGATPDRKAFGETVRKGSTTYAVELVDDLLNRPDETLSDAFVRWKRAVSRLKKGNETLVVKRIAYGDSAAFDFLEQEGIHVKVLGPIVEAIDGVPALPFLGGENGTGTSASATINGHSIVLHLTVGNVRLLMGADLNRSSEKRLLERAGKDGTSLTAEVLKVPHHGSADFAPQMLSAVQPVVSIISSGDESQAREYIHPRAGLVGALGKYSREDVEKPLVYVTEMVAFFERLGLVHGYRILRREKKQEDLGELTNTYRKISFGIVHVRTDGDRVLVATHSGKPGMKESYAFHVDGQGKIRFESHTNEI